MARVPGAGTPGVPGWLPPRFQDMCGAPACCGRGSCELPAAGGDTAPVADGANKAGEEAEDGLAAELDAEEPPAVVKPSSIFPWCSREAESKSGAGAVCACAGPCSEEREGEAVDEHASFLRHFDTSGPLSAGTLSTAELLRGASEDELGQPNLVLDWDELLRHSWRGEAITSALPSSLAGLGGDTSKGSGFWRSVSESSPPKPCSSSHFCRGDSPRALRCFKPDAGLEHSKEESEQVAPRGVVVLVNKEAGADTSVEDGDTGRVAEAYAAMVASGLPPCFQGDIGGFDGCGSDFTGRQSHGSSGPRVDTPEHDEEAAKPNCGWDCAATGAGDRCCAAFGVEAEVRGRPPPQRRVDSTEAAAMPLSVAAGFCGTVTASTWHDEITGGA